MCRDWGDIAVEDGGGEAFHLIAQLGEKGRKCAVQLKTPSTTFPLGDLGHSPVIVCPHRSSCKYVEVLERNPAEMGALQTLEVDEIGGDRCG
jgi:hypothetical protein